MKIKLLKVDLVQLISEIIFELSIAKSLVLVYTFK